VKERLLAALAFAGLCAGGAARLAGQAHLADQIWGVIAALSVAPLGLAVLRSLKRRDVGVDAIALVAITTAVVLGEELAAAIVALMMSGGAALEAWASTRARRALHLLVERAPRTARRVEDNAVTEIAVDSLVPGDLALVLKGEVVPADGVVEGDEAVIDESTLTGEPLPIVAKHGHPVRSGTANAGDAFKLRVVRPAAESAYARVVELVRAAEEDRAPFVRLADRYAAIFLPVTLVVAVTAGVIAGDARRSLAVLVVATPCPLILAAPIAFVAGLSRAARIGIIVKGAGAIERLGETKTVLLDKTGTLTLGRPQVERIVPLDTVEPLEALRLAASLDQLSSHSLALGLVEEARRRGLTLTFPTDVKEEIGKGIEGTVDGRSIAVGSGHWLEERHWHGAAQAAASLDAGESPGHARVIVGVDGRVAAAIMMGDRLRPGAEGLGGRLRATGVTYVALVSGDAESVAAAVGAQVGVDRVYAHQTPEEKLEVVRSLKGRRELGKVAMVGDGINDAPALAIADVGIAMGSAGATVSSETADVVITVERVDRVVEAIRIGRRSLAIARQSVVVGLALSLGAMAVAAAGMLPPVAGAILQEGIDIAVIANALRALRS
jgi:heavy metal translocating P-type ATPase